MSHLLRHKLQLAFQIVPIGQATQERKKVLCSLLKENVEFTFVRVSFCCFQVSENSISDEQR